MRRTAAVHRLARSILPALPLGALLCFAACNDDSPTSDGTMTTTTTAPASSANAFLRAAQLAFDARTVDLVVNGETEAGGVPYLGVSDYVELEPGEYRIQFFPAGNHRSVLIETMVSLSSGEFSTAALVGLSQVDLVLLDDPHVTAAGTAAVTMVNAIPDFPTPLDGAVVNGPTLFQNVGYLDTSAPSEVVPGVYALKALRAGTAETVATSAGNDFASGGNYTVFAAGSLRRNDMTLVVASDRR